MTSPFDAQGLQFAWDSTSLKMAQECLWKYKAIMLDGWRSPRESVHLRFGGHYATALEHFHKHRAAGMDRTEALRAVVHEALIATWDDGAPWESADNRKTRDSLIRTIVWYFDQFADDPTETVILPSGAAGVEYSFQLELDGGLVYCGHIDRLVTYNDQVYVQDQKTTGGTLSPHYFSQFDPDVQMSGYAFAAQAIWPGPISGVMIDAAQIQVGFSRFERGFTYRTPAKLEEWYQDSLYWINLAREATAEGRFPRNRTSCDKFAGCQFRVVCSRSPEVRGQFLKADFVQGKKWNPLEKR